jgi:hypothetical protein
MKKINFIKAALVSSVLALLSGCQDPISAMMVKKTESDWRDINSVNLYDPITLGTKPNNGTNVRVSNKMFVELDNPDRINIGSTSVALEVIPYDGIDSKLLYSQIEKELKNNGFSISPTGKPLTVKVKAMSENTVATTGNVHALSGIGSISGGLGATIAQGIATEAVGAVVSSRPGDNGIARGVAFSITSGNESRNIKLDHIEGIDLKANNPEAVKARDMNLFIAMIARSTAELLKN